MRPCRLRPPGNRASPVAEDVHGHVVRSWLLLGRLLDSVTRDPTPIMLVVIGLLFIAAAITIFGVKEKSSLEGLGDRGQGRWLEQFRIDFRANPSYWWVDRRTHF
jgi:hypothetical protein